MCIFCSLPKKRIIRESKNFNVIRDLFPISDGHTLITSKGHFQYLDQLSEEFAEELWNLIRQTQKSLTEQYNCNGFNIGINDGITAGQTIEHFHVHIIPRYSNDVKDPRGGIRWIIPEKADYWT